MLFHEIWVRLKNSWIFFILYVVAMYFYNFLTYISTIKQISIVLLFSEKKRTMFSLVHPFKIQPNSQFYRNRSTKEPFVKCSAMLPVCVNMKMFVYSTSNVKCYVTMAKCKYGLFNIFCMSENVYSRRARSQWMAANNWEENHHCDNATPRHRFFKWVLCIVDI